MLEFITKAIMAYLEYERQVIKVRTIFPWKTSKKLVKLMKIYCKLDKNEKTILRQYLATEAEIDAMREYQKDSYSCRCINENS